MSCCISAEATRCAARFCLSLAIRAAGSREHKLAAQVRRVDWLQTAGELGAMLLEAEWIKSQQAALQPSPAQQCGIGDLDGSPMRRAACAYSASTNWSLRISPQSFGVFHSEKDARKALTEIARARQLCLKVLGLEESEGSCFALQVGKCKRRLRRQGAADPACHAPADWRCRH